MAINTKSISQLVDEFRKIHSKDAITPDSLGYILFRIVELIKHVESPEIFDFFITLAESFKVVGKALTSVEPGNSSENDFYVSFGKVDLSSGELSSFSQILIPNATASSAGVMSSTYVKMLTAAYPPTLSLSQLDTLGHSTGVAANRDAILKNPHTRYRLIADGWNPTGTIPPKVLGFVDVFSDSMRHVITEEITTHDCFDEQGNLQPTTHTDTAIRTYYRSFNLNAADDFPIDKGQWTKWREKEPEGLRALALEALTIAKKALELAQSGSPTVEFSGFVSSPQLQPMSVSMSSTDAGFSAVFDSGRKTFLLKSASGSYYNNWADGDRFGTASVDGRIPQTGKIYADTVSGNWYRWDGANLVKFNSGVADPALKDTIITNTEIDDLLESLGQEETGQNKPGGGDDNAPNTDTPVKGDNENNSGGAEENGQQGTAVPGGNNP